MTQFPDLFQALLAPFDSQEVRTRTQGNQQVQYITARVAMNRLDDVLGPENWWDSYDPGENSVLCRLTVRLPDGSTLTKADAGGYAGMPDAGDDDKSGFSDAFKRAAVKFGVGRYLYREGIPSFVKQPDPNPVVHHQPDPGPPPKVKGTWGQSQTKTQTAGGKGNHPPRTGGALWRWARDQDDRDGLGLVSYLDRWGKLQGYPKLMKDWDASMVSMAYGEAVRKMESIAS